MEETPAKRPAHRYEAIARLFNTAEGKPHISVPRKPGGVIVGRSNACDVKLGGADISLKHCVFSLSNNGGLEQLLLTDTSTNGTFVNDELIGKGSTVLLRSGDKVAFASSQYIFRYMSDAGKRSFFDDYILMNQLGSGHYAVVKEARDRTTGDIVAVKIFHPNRSGEDPRLKQEMELLLLVSHPNIVRFMSHYVELQGATSTTYIVLEKVNGGELFQRIVNKLKLGQDETRAIFTQLLAGLGHLHAHNIIHRDIKPENVLLDIIPRLGTEKQTGPWDEGEYDVKVKIADFGLAKFIGELRFTNTLCGTPAYVAPEVLANDRNYSTKVDLWLAGVLLYVCLCGFPPFSDELGPPNMREQILQGRYAFYSPFWDEIPDSALDLISNLLMVDFNNRLDIHQTLSHPWFSETQVLPLVETPQVRAPLRANTQPLTLRERFTSGLNND